MIESFTSKETEKIFIGEVSKKLPIDIQRTARRKLLYLDDADDLQDLQAVPGNRLEKLKGDRAGQHSIHINDQWRMNDILSPIHPGEVLLEDFMKPLGLTQYRLAQDIGVSPIRISQIVHGERSITVDTALRLARYFGTSAAVWLRLQVRYDLEVAEKDLGERIKHEVKIMQQPVMSV